MDRISKRKIEMFLSKVPSFSNPILLYEQYTIMPSIAAKIIWIAETVFRDICGKTIIDLGCGTGRLLIGSLFMNPAYVIGIDIDLRAIRQAKNLIKKNMIEKYWRVDFICADINKLCIRKRVHTVIENPPFGVHRKGYDVLFLLKAISLADNIYTIHKYNTSIFIVRLLDKLGYKAEKIFDDEIYIPSIYQFHRKKIHKVKISVFRVTRGGKNE